MALPSVVESIEDLKESNTDNRERLQKSLRAGLLNVVKSVESLHTTMMNAFDLDKRTAEMQKLQDLRNAELLAELMAQREEKEKPGEQKAAAGGTNWAAILGGAVALITGMIAGFFEQFRKTWAVLKELTIKNFTSLINFVKESKLFGRLTQLWKDFSTGIITRFRNAVTFIKETNIFKSIMLIVDDIKMFGTNLFSRIKNFLRIDDVIGGWKAEIELWKPITERVGKLFKLIGDPLLKIGDSLTEAKNVAISLGQAVIKPFVAAWNFISDTFKSVLGTVSKFAGPGSPVFGIGKLIGKLFYPITLIMSVIDTVTGAVQGYEKEGIIGAIKGGLSGLLSGIIGAPLDLLKGAVSYILEFFGFDKASETLDSFSFSDLIKKMVGGIFDFVSGTINFVIDLFKDPGKAIGDLAAKANEFLKKILRVILPVPDESDSWYSPKKLIKAAIPDSVYEYAGLDPKTGQMTPETAAAQALEESKSVSAAAVPSGGNAGAEVQARTEASLQKSGAQNITTNAPTMINAPSMMKQSSMTVLPASSRNSSPSPTAGGWTDPMMVGA